MSRKPERIAVVGLGGVFPEAPTLERFWDNLAARRCAAKPVPVGRWLLSAEDAFDPRKGADDKVYSLNACLIEGFAPDLAGFELPEALLKELDPLFHLGLHAAREAWRAAATGKVDRSRVGVIMGHIVLPSDSSSALSREILTPAFERHGLGRQVPPASRRVHPLNRCVAGLPAGLIARALGLGGTAYTLDAACASSLYAVKLAIEELRSGRADAMLTGGLSRPESLYTQMGFSQLRALSSRGIPAPFDAAGDGLVVGEGAGMLMLKRYDDAVRDGDRIRGVICGAGLSNDVGGSLLAPNTVGQLRAMRAAYQEAGWSPSQVDYVECHATGTPTGDPVEIASLKALWGERGWTAGQCALGSVKSNVGHMLTAAGAAGLIKMLLAFEKKTLPPTANFTRANPQLGLDGSPFRVQSEARPWEPRADGPRRAAVSGFGFGGINAHLLIEEAGSARSARRKSRNAPSSLSAVPIAIVGMDARVGPLSSLREFQEAVLSGKALEPSTPESRWFGVEGERSVKGFFLRSVGVKAADYRVPPKEIEDMLPQQLLMLDTAAHAIKDAKLAPEGREKCGVFIGLGLDLNTCNFNFRWSLIAKARELAKEKGWSLDSEQFASLLSSLRDAAGPALSANRTMGALGGIVASRVAREFQIGGPSFTISSEETSGLRALEAGARALQRGELDSAVVGAVDVAGDARQLLAAHESRPFAADAAAKPFDRAAAGTAPGEGAVCLVLKRLDDAVKNGDRIYAVIRGLGASCGGGVDQQSPSAEAYGAALRRAYAEAGVDASTVSYLETHGSGVPAEDAAEARALAEFFGVTRTEPPCALGAVKAQVGHLGAASGLVGVAKAALALYQEILPPCRPFDAVDELARARKRFHVPTRAQYWLRNRAEGPRRAGVSGLGLDGGAAHVVLEGFQQDSPEIAAERRQPLGARAEALFALEADDAAGLIAGCADLRRWAADQEPEAAIEALARRWLARRGQEPGRPLGLALVARSWKQLLELAQQAEGALRDNPERPLPGDRVHFTTRPSFGAASTAFVFPGSGNQYLGMGVGLGAQFPEILRAQDAENGYLRRQLVPERYAPQRFDWKPGWEAEAERELSEDYRSMIFGSVAHGTVVSDLMRSLGAAPKFVIGYSLGETAGLFALRAWTARDEMHRRMNESSLFVSDLAGPCDAARQFWNLPTDERVDWVLGVIDRPADTVRKALKGAERAALLIVNAPLECVVGGYRKAVDSLVDGLGCVFLPLQGVSTVHFPAAKLVEKQYRELHLQPTSAPEGIRFYSGVTGKAFEVTRESAADSITAQAIKGFDYSAVVRQAYEDGARVFLELGPQNSCTRMIGKILGPLPHAARAACVRGQDETGTILRAAAQLIAERIPIDLKRLYGGISLVVGHQAAAEAPTVFARLGGAAPSPVMWTPRPEPASSVPQAVPIPAETKREAPKAVPTVPATYPPFVHAHKNVDNSFSAPAPTGAAASPVIAAFVDAQTASAKAHESFLAVSRKLAELQATVLSGQAVLPDISANGGNLSAPPIGAVPRALTREQCLEFAVGSIAKVLGPRFAAADGYPTRVRLPDEPLMLVDRITEIEGEPQSMGQGRVVTEHDVKAGAWYLDNGRIPTCVAVEAGQADLFLSGYLGIDDRTQGLSVYRLLDAEVTFHGPLPAPGQVIRYDIRIERFIKHGDAWLFFFHYDGTVGREKLITMRNGCAGFFSQEELAAGKGIVLTADEKKPVAGKGDFSPLAALGGNEAYDDEQLNALRRGDLAACFGPQFGRLESNKPLGWLGLPNGRMNLVHRINELVPRGGRYGLGWIRGEADIHPDDWHLTCHFTDDNVMPGTLMYECCLHTMRVLLMRLGIVGRAETCVHEPVAGVKSKLKCRGQVLAHTKKVHYEISIKELGYNPAPYAIADALMFSDGKPIVHISDMSLQLTGATREELEAIWSGQPAQPPVPKRKAPLFDHERILQYAIGKPSEAFGDPYKIFDEDRIIARLPGPPYQFLDRIVDIQGCKPFQLAAGGRIEAEYDVPRDAWYFKSHRQPTMPFAVLLEAALQPCGWFAAYLGSALTSPIDLKFRNLGGTATQFREVTPASGTLRTAIQMTKVSQAGGMIIQNYTMKVRDDHGAVYEGVTEFGFFTAEALGAQLGIRGAKPYAPSAELQTKVIRPSLEDLHPPLPDPMLLMLDEVELYPEAGAQRLGFVKGRRKVNPSEWFFKAHFYQDPVCPGSLGLESFIELLKSFAAVRWPSRAARYEAMVLGRPHTWLYRGQYTPVNKQVEVQAVITAVDDASKTVVADGYLSVDGLTIYSMKDFSLRLT